MPENINAWVHAGEGRLYRETPAALTKAKPPKGRGAAAWEPQDGPWELLGTTSDELTEIGEKLQRSKKDQDRTLAVKVRPLATQATTKGSRHCLPNPCAVFSVQLAI